MSPIRSGRRAPRETAAACRTMSSIVTGTVVGYPSTTMPSESPTRMTSMPAWSTRRANAASYAVIIVMRLPSRFIATRSGTVTFFGAGTDVPPYWSLTSNLRPGRLRAGPGVAPNRSARPYLAGFIPARGRRRREDDALAEARGSDEHDRADHRERDRRRQRGHSVQDYRARHRAER